MSSAEQERFQKIADAHGPETRKGADARSRLADIERQHSKDDQLKRGTGQFIPVPKLTLKERAARRAARR